MLLRHIQYDMVFVCLRTGCFHKQLKLHERVSVCVCVCNSDATFYVNYIT